ncbi:MAG: recombinase family protein [Clostridiales bacterium]|nr:recombinase family protein [Clostridiales bacterium]
MARKSRKVQILPASEAVAVSTAARYNAAVYVRLSVEDNNLDDGYSIEAQRDMLLGFIEVQEDMALADVYCDNGATGSNFDRDGFNRIMDDIKGGKVNAVVVKDLSRFGRNYIETSNYIEKIFPFMGVRFVSVNDGYDSERDSAADIMVTLRNIVNHAYVTDISRKIKTMFTIKQNNGDFIGWSAPYGYRKSEKNNNRLVIDPETAPIARQIFEWKAEGIGMMAIARRLNEMGIPSPRQRNIAMGRYKNTPPKDGQFWTDATVSWIIKSPAYAGHMTQRKFTRNSVNGRQIQLPIDEWVVVRNTHEAIISDELWETVQAVTKKHANNFGVNRRKRNANKGENILKGILYCPCCKKAMQHKVDPKYNYRHYFCQMRRANPNCTTEPIKEAELLEAVFAAVEKKITAAVDTQKLLVKVSGSKAHLDRLESIRQSIRNANMAIKRNAALRGRLFDTFGDGLITEAEFRQMKDDYTAEAERLQSGLAELNREHARLTSVFTKDNERIASFAKFKNQKALTGDMVSELIEKIIVHGAERIEIVWRYEDEYNAVCEMAKAGGV